MCDFEIKNKNLNELSVKSWGRFVCDTFTLSKKSSAITIFDYLNIKHKSITFLMEKEENNSLNLIDVTKKKKAI